MKISQLFAPRHENTMKIKCWFCLMSLDPSARGGWTFYAIWCSVSFQIIHTCCSFVCECVLCSHNSLAYGQMHSDNKRIDRMVNGETNFSIFRNIFFCLFAPSARFRFGNCFRMIHKDIKWNNCTKNRPKKDIIKTGRKMTY